MSDDMLSKKSMSIESKSRITNHLYLKSIFMKMGGGMMYERRGTKGYRPNRDLLLLRSGLSSSFFNSVLSSSK